MNDVSRFAVDAIRGKIDKYSDSKNMDILRKELIAANGGSTEVNYKNIRDGKCAGLFTIVEEIIGATVIDDVANNAFFNAMVDFRNMALEDRNEFLLENAELFFVDEIADGTQAIRRQRIDGYKKVIVPTSMKAVRIYDELNRVLSGRVDFTHLIDLVSRSFNQKIMQDVYSLWAKATYEDLGGLVYFPAAGAYDEDTLLGVIEHVEAAAGGKIATILGTKKGLRTISSGIDSGIQSDLAKDGMFNYGYAGKFYGSPVMEVPQRHKVGTTDFVFNDNSLLIVAGDDKPIKFVYEGDPIVIPGDPLKNADLTQEYFTGLRYGAALAIANGNGGIGRYEMTESTT